MGTAILLSSQNSLNHRFDHQTLTHQNPNSCPRRHSYAATTTPRRRKRIPTASQPTVVKPTAANTNLVIGQVKILKRGETLSAFHKKETNSCSDRDDTRRPVFKMNDVDLIVTSTNRLGPEPETLLKQIGAFKGVEIFAGAGCSVSPSPSSVPIPCFLGKNKLSI
ncbi:hypothetical protein V5N11_001154 [Cardamine amara subsp. amara]|uniref:Uncharacterized protein n=1 Tax=Cardamine amara subsp. amara TaxID=228776 RepID=A0ABD0ZTX0_CARAN